MRSLRPGNDGGEILQSIILRQLDVAEVSWLIALELQAAAQGYIRGDDEETHRARLRDQDCAYLVAEDAGERLGYAILRGLSGIDRSIELKRVVMGQPGQGAGTRVLKAILSYVFDDLKAHRLWLDALADNLRAQHVYENLGFVREGRLRGAIFVRGGFTDLILYGMLASEV
jgi:ribosomal protein S18 acetylase RimI-like enzyme